MPLTEMTSENDVLQKNRPTIADVARVAGVSRTTVSYVLSERPGARVPEPTRRRIWDAAARVGYRRNALAVAFRSGRMNTIGIVCPASMLTGSSAHPGNIYYRDLLFALVSAVFDAGLTPLLMSEDASRQISLSDITDRKADGVILVVKDKPHDFVQAAQNAGVPCVTVGREYGAWQVNTDNVLGAHLAVTHLLDLGHRRIAYFWHGKKDVPSARQRLEGWQAALQKAGCEPVGNDDVFSDAPESVADLIEKIKRPIGSNVSAVFCYNDEMALQLLDTCHDNQISVPSDVSLVGFDNNIIATAARPRLTTVESPIVRIAETAIELILTQLNSPDIAPPKEAVTVSPTLVVGASSGPPPPSFPV